MRRLLPIASIVLAALAIPAPPLAAKPHAGSVDRSFGRNGSVVFNLPGEQMGPRAVAVDDSGKILVAGEDAEVVRFLPNGRLDPAFGAGGIARVPLPRPVSVDGLALQPDGALLLSGITVGDGGERVGAVARLLPTGAVDPGFGSQGLAIVPGENSGIPPSVDSLPHIGVQAGGRIVAAGSQRASDVHNPADPFVVRLLPDGMPDPSFDGNGTARAGTSHPAAVSLPGRPHACRWLR
jgi:uncharacterized delta-60 repeat protein